MEPGYIHSIESFGTVDGPGIRYVIFFQGCPMRCLYCHNPDSWEMGAGEKMTVFEVLCGFQKNAEFYKTGGITASGGEPLMQLSFLTELFHEAKQRGISTCLDTSGIAFTQAKIEEYKKLCGVTDYVLLDIKYAENEMHKKITGMGNENIWSFLEFLDSEKVPVRIRHVLVPGLTLTKEGLSLLGKRLLEFHNIKEIELLPYHTMGEGKYNSLGIPYPLSHVVPPSGQEKKEAEDILKQALRKGFL